MTFSNLSDQETGDQIEYVTVANYKMASTGITQTLYHPHNIYYPPQYQQHQSFQHSKPEFESNKELSRTSTNTSTGASISSDIYVDPDQDYKIVLRFTKQEILLVQSTWREMISDDLKKSDKSQNSSNVHSSIASSLFCIQFYSNLLAMDNKLEELFPSIKHQAVSFAGVLSTAIHSLENLSALDDYLSNLGKRHARILGIDPPHFELMGVALLKTFRDRFGDDFSLELERCWARLYTYLANSILQFGLDPVLRNDKINDEFNNNISRNTSASSQSSSIFENTNRTTSHSSVSTAPRSLITDQTKPSLASYQRALNKPAFTPVTGNQLDLAAAVSASKFGTKATKGSSSRGFQKTGKKSELGANAGDDEKCVIT